MWGGGARNSLSRLSLLATPMLPKSSVDTTLAKTPKYSHEMQSELYSFLIFGPCMQRFETSHLLLVTGDRRKLGLLTSLNSGIKWYFYWSLIFMFWHAVHCYGRSCVCFLFHCFRGTFNHSEYIMWTFVLEVLAANMFGLPLPEKENFCYILHSLWHLFVYFLCRIWTLYLTECFFFWAVSTRRYNFKRSWESLVPKVTDFIVKMSSLWLWNVYSSHFTNHIQLLCSWTLSVILFSFETRNVSESEFSLRLQVEPTQLGQIDRARRYIRTKDIAQNTDPPSHTFKFPSLISIAE
jgi:hypothetical protein